MPRSPAAARLVLAALAAPACSLLIPGCSPREVIPYERQGYGVLQRDPNSWENDYLYGNYSFLGNGIEHYGPPIFNDGNGIDTVPTGALTTICIASAVPDELQDTYDLLISREGSVDPPAAMCALVQFVPVPGKNGHYDLHADYHMMIDGYPKCASNGRAPRKMNITGFDYEGSLIGRCPGPDVVPAILVQPSMNVSATIDELLFDVSVAFSPSAFVKSYLDGTAIVQTCILSVKELEPSDDVLPGMTALWEVKYGDPLRNYVTGCGLYAMIGQLTPSSFANLSYVGNFRGASTAADIACPVTLQDPNLVTLVNYFTVPAPTPSPTPPPNPPPPAAAGLSAGVLAGIVIGVGAAIFGAGLGALYATGRWVPGALYSRVGAEGAGGGDKGGFSDIAPRATEFMAVNAEGEEEEVECLPVAAATNLAKDAVQGARRAMSFSVQ